MKKPEFRIVYALIAICAFLYVLVRAVNVGVTYDEAWTIKDFVSIGVIDVLNYSRCDANNHILNTLLIKLFFVPGNHSLFIARLPNVLASILYLWFAYKISRELITGFIGLAAFSLLVFNPFLLDFFSLARGYGLSLGFQLASLYFLLIFIRDKHARLALLALVFGALAVICNFSVLNYWLVLVFAVNFFPFFSRETFRQGKILLNSLLVLLPLFMVIYEPIRKLRKNGNLYYGGEDSFYADTLVSLTKYSMYTTEASSAVYISLDVFLVVLAAALIASFYFRKFQVISFKMVLLALLVLSIASVVVQHYLLGTLYLIDRTALFFYPLIVLVLFFAIREYAGTFYARAGACLLVAAFGLNFFLHASFYKTATWYFDAHTTAILERLNAKGKREHRKISIDYSWPFQNSIEYYFNAQKYPFLERMQHASESQGVQADYYIYLGKSLEKVGYDANAQRINDMPKDTAWAYPKESVSVYRRR